MSKTYTLAEVAKHTNEKDCWLVIHGKVYDVTDFLDEHPGGFDIVVSNSGKDATEDFDEIGHSNTASDMLRDYLIGELSGGGAKTAPARGAAVPAAAAVNPATMMARALLPILVILLAAFYALYLR